MDSVFSESAYQALIQDIFRRFPSVQQGGFTPGTYKPGLDGMKAFDQALGHPSAAFRSVHIAGTNGKGSVANMLASALTGVGYKTALFTSPHLLDFRERMRIGGFMIPKRFVFDFLTEWLPWISEHSLSFFEITTGLAFSWFASENVDIAIIETGLGGRLDSTNIITPVLSVVTTIGLDHCALLGDSLEEIAREKAGIFKAGVNALIGESVPETQQVFNDIAWMYCPLQYAQKLHPRLWNRHKQIIQNMDLQAPVQERNLRTVLAALDLLRPDWPLLDQDEKVEDAIIHTARNMDFHGRWERLSTHPLVIADIGHNPQAMKYNFAALEKMLQGEEHSILTIVYGIMADKDLDSIIPMMPRNATYIFCSPDSERALPAGEILRKYLDFRRSSQIPGPERAFSAGSVRQAVQMAIQLSKGTEGTVIYIGGSAYVVAEALPLFRGLPALKA